jgi:L-lactate dehydrogenase complex protein LldG
MSATPTPPLTSAQTGGDARTAVLKQIRRALAEPTQPSLEALAAAWQLLPRDYARSSDLSAEARLDLLQDRLEDYDAEVTRVSEAEVAPTIAAVLARRGNRPTLVPSGFPAAWLPADSALVEDQDFSRRELDRFDGVVTTATVAIADTGSLVLQGVPGQGRRAATLVPDFHLCVVRASDVVQSVPEAFARLEATATLPTTFVSGPSATADIEMTRIKGVHGPRFLHVLLVL